MFRYNRFWHFWFQLNNQHYFASLVISLLLVPAAVFFPPLWTLVVAVPLIVGGTIALFTQLSNFFYSRQNQRLTQIKTETTDEALKEEIDLYLNRRVVCPEELLAGAHLNIPHDTPKMKKAVANTPLVFETEDTLNITKALNDIHRRNPAIKATSESNQLYVKTVAAKDGLSEVAAREMAEILGFEGLIPSNTIAGMDVLHDHENERSIPNAGLVLSRQKIREVIDKRREESPERNITNSPGVQNAVAKFVFNLKTAAYRTKAQKEEQFKLLHVQKLIPNAVDGLQVYTQLFNEPAVLFMQSLLGGLIESDTRDQRAQAKKIIQKISLPSFQENFLLHLILGSQDANPGNTLFTDGPNDSVILHSIDHERIMPEDNYNVTKKIPVANGTNLANMTEKDIENVFPIRLWLAGLPQANVPFTKEVIEKALDSLNPERLLTYHHQKKLFSSAAVGAQLERILLIKNVFEEEIKKSQITLTPKQLYLKLINNHPTYIFLKNELQFSELSTFLLLGLIPEGADMSLLRHPLQWFPMIGMIVEAQLNEQQGRPSFSEESFNSSHAHHLLFFSAAKQQKMAEEANKAGLDILSEVSAHLGLH
ncbi:hypothetical protein [Legionella worsleiensis]|uniref:Uncharacterized protein n=1 Tax=Legionella worsleiensis TaxID=45076 RepID=A0A0W1AE85_9GAMM|nr:hypothetical protein [Legionella worsleiensis]KTD79645.1 hypothetical protein Lwor_1159 [Legionella worsleiensis]STY32155.1 Uncharacterised protein [Legionella worsleiensis]